MGWTPFVESDNEFLWFCLTVRDSGIAASARLEIKDGVRALDLDTAVTLRLLHFDNEKQANFIKAQANRTAYEVSRKLFGGGDEIDDFPDLIKNDPWADVNTVIS